MVGCGQKFGLHAVELVPMFRVSNRKNAAGIRLAIDAVEDVVLQKHLTHVVFDSADSDFAPLAQRCRRLDKHAVGIGTGGPTSIYLARACNEYHASTRVAPAALRRWRVLEHGRALSPATSATLISSVRIGSPSSRVSPSIALQQRGLMHPVKRAIPHVLAMVALVVGVVGSLIDFIQPWVVIGVGVTAFGVMVFAAILDVRNSRTTIFRLGGGRADKGRAEIQEYMKDLIYHSSSAVVFSRDMSWAEDSGPLLRILRERAQSRSLELVIQSPTALSRDLESNGATVNYYGAHFQTPLRTRFTIINPDSSSSELAIGRTNSGFHTIERFSESSEPVVHMAHDLLSMVRSTCAAAPEVRN